MLLIVSADINRGVSFAGKFFVQPKAVEEQTKQIRNQLPDIETVEYKDFNGDWTLIDKIIIFSTNKVYPADKFFKFPANYRYLISDAFNFAGEGEIYTAEVFKRA